MDSDFAASFIEENSEDFVGSSNIGVYILDGAAITLNVNKGYQNITGIERKDLIGLHAKDVEDKGFIDNSVSLLVKEKQAPICITQKILKTNKKIFATGSPIYDDKGNIILIAITAMPFNSRRNLKVESPRRILGPINGLEGIIFKSDVMQQVLIRAIRAAAMKSTILILGDSGVGKDVVAKIVHQASPRKDKPFIKINTTAIPEELFESELFGYAGGAFTGASKEGKIGLVQAASGGTLFLDEISELTKGSQVKLLRLLQNREITRIGSTTTKKVDVRFIAATNRDLFSMVQSGQFREDLFYRLNVVPIYIPPLGERKEDVYVLAAHFLSELCNEYQIEKKFTPGAIQVLTDYSWPGNVRELQNLIERLVALYTQKDITKEHVISELAIRDKNGVNFSQMRIEQDLNFTMDNVEKEFLLKIYKAHNCNLKKTADALGVHRTTAMRKLKKFNILD